MTDCDGLCVLATDVGVPAAGVAYPHPGCPLHAPDQVCGCGQPDRCMSPTHGQVTTGEALRIRHSQAGPCNDCKAGDHFACQQEGPDPNYCGCYRRGHQEGEQHG